MVDIEYQATYPGAPDDDKSCDSCGVVFEAGQSLLHVKVNGKSIKLCCSGGGEPSCAEKLRRLLNP